MGSSLLGSSLLLLKSLVALALAVGDLVPLPDLVLLNLSVVGDAVLPILLDFALESVSVVGDAVPPLPILLLDDLPDLLDGNESVGELVSGANGFPLPTVPKAGANVHSLTPKIKSVSTLEAVNRMP